MSRSATSTTEGGRSSGDAGLSGWRARRVRLRLRRERRRRWRLVLIGGVAVLVAYYGLIITGMRLGESGAVHLKERGVSQPAPADRVTLEITATELDPAAGSLDLQLRPVPHGGLADEGTGELRRPLQVRLTSPGQPVMAFDFPARQIIDPVAATVTATSGASRFPFDRPSMAFRLEAVGGANRHVPVDVDISDQTEGWNLSGDVRSSGGVLHVGLDGGREMLTISFALLYIMGIAVVALITVAIIGGAIVRGVVGFDQIIWLGAMLVAIPAMRNEMPGVPPIGTAIDLWVFLPSVVIVGVALLAAIVVLVYQEARAASDSSEAVDVVDVSDVSDAGELGS